MAQASFIKCYSCGKGFDAAEATRHDVFPTYGGVPDETQPMIPAPFCRPCDIRLVREMAAKAAERGETDLEPGQEGS